MSGKQFTGIDGALYCDGNKVGRISSWTFQASAATLDTTTLGDFASTSVYGIQSFQGSATLFYYEEDGGQIEGSALMSDVMRTTMTPTEPTHSMELRYNNGASVHGVSFDCLLNQVGISATAGGIVSAAITFTVTGALKTATIA